MGAGGVEGEVRRQQIGGPLRKIVCVEFVIGSGQRLRCALAASSSFVTSAALRPRFSTRFRATYDSRRAGGLADVRDRALGAIALVAPGMLLDRFTTVVSALVRQHMARSGAGVQRMALFATCSCYWQAPCGAGPS